MYSFVVKRQCIAVVLANSYLTVNTYENKSRKYIVISKCNDL